MTYDLSALQVYAVADRSGTVAQLTIDEPTPESIALGDTGTLNGFNDGTAVALPFTVCQINDANNFCITTILPSGAAGPQQQRWPQTGSIEWTAGANAGHSPQTEVIAQNAANAYLTEDGLFQYANSRGLSFPASPLDAVQQAIVLATDYLDQRYKYRGVKLLQFLTNPALDPNIAYVDPWLFPGGFGIGFGYGLLGFNPLVGSASYQRTQWPRAGVVDASGDTVYSIPLAIQQACASLALRLLDGTVTTLQPDYDSGVFATPGAIVSETTSQVGPITVRTAFDTKFGTGFMPEYPNVKRLLMSAGLLASGGGRSIVR